MDKDLLLELGMEKADELGLIEEDLSEEVDVKKPKILAEE